LAHRQPGFVEIGCSDAKKFILWTRNEVYDAIDLLKVSAASVTAGTSSKTKHTKLEFALGFNHVSGGLLQDCSLRKVLNPVTSATYDWVHTLLQGGVMVIEMELLLEALETIGIERRILKEFLHSPDWRFPKWIRYKSISLHRVMDECRRSVADSTKLKCSCSEMLSLYGLMRHFVDVAVAGRPAVAGQVASFKALCRVIDIILSAKRGCSNIRDTSAALSTAINRFMDLHKSMYGEEFLVPKHHWLCDLPSQLLRDGLVLDCFVVERMHLQVKRTSENVKNLKFFERATMRGVMNSYFAAAEDSAGDGLRGKTLQCPGTRAAIAQSMRVWNFEVSVGDIILRGEECGCVVACASEDGELLAIVDVMTTVSQIGGGHAVKARSGASRAVWPANQIEHSVGWRMDGDLMIVVRM
jgi:hypothetical protein